MTDEIKLATPERAGKGKVLLKPREVSAGGNVVSVGQVDAWHCYLDFLHDLGLLGPEPQASRRHDDGLAFFELYVRTHPSQKSNVRDAARGGQAGEGPTYEGDIGTTMDKLQTEWLKVTQYLGRRFKLLADYCIDAMPPPAPITLGEEPKAPFLSALAQPKDEREAKAYQMEVQAWQDDHREWSRLKARRDMQQSLVDAHVTAFRLVCPAVLDALDALSDAMERAHADVWGDEK